MDKWEQSMTDKLAESKQNEEDIKYQHLEFLKNLTDDTDKEMILTLDTIFELLEKQAEQMTLFIGKELEKVKHLKKDASGKDADLCQIDEEESEHNDETN